MGVSTVSIDSAHIWYFRQLRQLGVIDFTILFLSPLPRPLSPTLAENLIDIRKRFWHKLAATYRHVCSIELTSKHMPIMVLPSHAILPSQSEDEGKK